MKAFIKRSLSELTPPFLVSMVYILMLAVLSASATRLPWISHGLVVVLGALALLFARRRQGFGQRLFTSAVVINLAVNLSLSATTSAFHRFNAAVTSGHFVVDKLFSNFFYLPWQNLALIFVANAAIYLVYKTLAEKRFAASA